MSKRVGKGSALFGPGSPALVTCTENGRTNVLTIAWTGVMSSKPPMTYISVRPERFSYGMIDRTGEFIINFPTSAMARETDFCGVRSGRDTDKLEKCSLGLVPGTEVGTSAIEQCPLSLECRVRQKIDMGSHTAFIAEIVAVQADERYIDSKGKLNLNQAGMLAYLHGEYFATGRKCGSFGFSVKKRRK